MEKSRAVGKVIPLSLYDYGFEADYRVSGVFEDVPENSHLALEALVPFDESLHSEQILSNWRAALIFTYAKLVEGVNPTDIEYQLPELERQVVPPSGSWDVAKSLVNTLHRVDELHLFQNGTDDMKPLGNVRLLYIYALSGFLLVLIAGTNFVNTMVVQAQFRIKEVALRKVFGAGLPQIQLQFLPEALLISLGAFYLSVIGFEFWGDQIFDLIGYLGCACGFEPHSIRGHCRHARGRSCFVCRAVSRNPSWLPKRQSIPCAPVTRPLACPCGSAG